MNILKLIFKPSHTKSSRLRLAPRLWRPSAPQCASCFVKLRELQRCLGIYKGWIKKDEVNPDEWYCNIGFYNSEVPPQRPPIPKTWNGATLKMLKPQFSFLFPFPNIRLLPFSSPSPSLGSSKQSWTAPNRSTKSLHPHIK